MFLPAPMAMDIGSVVAEKPCKILLFAIQTSHIGSCRLPKVLQGAGFHVAAVSLSGSLLRQSRYLDQWFQLRARRYGGWILKDVENAFSSYRPDIIVGCDERAALFLQHAVQMETRKPGYLSADLLACLRRSLGSLETLGQRSLKSETQQVALAAGVSIPRSLTVDTEADLERAIATLGMPLVLKLSHGAGGHGVRFCEDVDSARANFRAYLKGRSASKAFRRHLLKRDWFPSSSSITAQAYIDGRAVMSCATCLNGKMLSVVTARSLQSTGKRGSPSSVVNIEAMPEIEAMTAAMIDAFGASGIISFDFMIDANGKAYLLECNPRPTYIFHLAPLVGIDLGRSLLDAIRGRPPVAADRAGKAEAKVAFFPSEWRRSPDSIAIQDYVHDVPWDEPKLIRAMLKLPRRDWRRRPIP